MSDLPQKDLYRLIEIAAREQAEDEDRLTAEQVQRIATELDIAPEYVQEAEGILAEERAAEAAAEAQFRRVVERLLVGAGVVVAAILVLALIGRSSLNEHLGEAKAAKAQVRNVIERQVATEGRVKDEPDTAARQAERAGAENRVRIERKRYDAAATAYNQASAGLLGVLARGLFGFSSELPLSSGVEW